MQSDRLIPTAFGRARSRMGRATLGLTALGVSLAGLGACSSDEPSTSVGTDVVALVPDETAVAPGACEPSESLDAPSIETAGSTTLATLGIGNFGCAGQNGDGYISFNYNPVLIEGDGSIGVTFGEGITATLNWSGETPFTEQAPGSWTTSVGTDGCYRLSVDMTSASGASTATYGADIRVGDETVACPQRVVDPSDPSDGEPDVTSPPPPSVTTPRTNPATTSTT